MRLRYIFLNVSIAAIPYNCIVINFKRSITMINFYLLYLYICIYIYVSITFSITQSNLFQVSRVRHPPSLQVCCVIQCALRLSKLSLASEMDNTSHNYHCICRIHGGGGVALVVPVWNAIILTSVHLQQLLLHVLQVQQSVQPVISLLRASIRIFQLHLNFSDEHSNFRQLLGDAHVLRHLQI